MENTNSACRDRCCCFKCIYTSSCCLTADQSYTFVLDEMIEAADRIGSSAYAGDHSIRKSALLYKHLLFDLF